MVQLSYKKLRPYILTLVITGIAVGMGFWIYREFVLSKPVAISIASNIESEAPSGNSSATTEATASIPPLHPKRLQVPSIQVNAPVLVMGTTKEGLVDSPKTAWDVGWYEGSALPGASQGAVFIDGHVNDSLNSPGVFFRLAELTKGSAITIIRGDDTKITYRVEKTERQPLDQVNMNALLSSADPKREGLTLVTCGGVYDEERATFTERVVVYAIREQLT